MSMKKLYYLLLFMLAITACEPINELLSQSFKVDYLYGRWNSNELCCVFNYDSSGYTFNMNNESAPSHFTWSLNNDELLLQFGSMLDVQTKCFVVTKLTQKSLNFHDKINSNLKYNFQKSVDSYIDAEEIYRTWVENEVYYQFEQNGKGNRKNTDGSKEIFFWELTQDTLTMELENEATVGLQTYIITELSDSVFSFHNPKNLDERHILRPYHDTYADQKEKERKHIQDFIEEQGIKVISKEAFEAQGDSTSVEENEFVLFQDNGVYMQIVRKGKGEMMEDGDRCVFMVRYIEYNIADADTISGNLYASEPDKFTCERKGDTFSASFTNGCMYDIYGSAVPKGWLLPLKYITPGRPNDKAAKVRIIVPHSEGTSTAAQYVYPTYYEITYIPERG